MSIHICGSGFVSLIFSSFTMVSFMSDITALVLGIVLDMISPLLSFSALGSFRFATHIHVPGFISVPYLSLSRAITGSVSLSRVPLLA